MYLNHWLNSIADAGRELLFSRSRQQPKESDPGQQSPKTIGELCSELYSNKGEALGTALAREVVDAYSRMGAAERIQFFLMLINDYSATTKEIIRCADAYKDNSDFATFSALNQAMESPRQRLFRRINMAPGGTQTIVTMRRDLLSLLGTHDELQAVDADLQHLLSSWFNRGFLKLERIDWQTPAHILEKLIAYEAVHEMDGWKDLRRRLAEDRRCFAFFHPALPDDPLIFVEVALTDGLASSVQPLLAPKQEMCMGGSPDTAIFYSISNCQKGLKGISFGNFLIKQVVMELQQELPQLTKFATLSPIPGFRRWLEQQLRRNESNLLGQEELDLMRQLKRDNWHQNESLTQPMKQVLMRLCTHYLYSEKRQALPLDPVARFHLGNGAQIERLNWMGDTSENGISQSAGILVNYLYELEHVEKNHEAFINHGKIACSQEIHKLVRLSIF